MTRDQAMDLWQQFAETLRQIRTEQGDIHRDDSRIWDGFLHVWDNEHWTAVTELVIELYEHSPRYFEQYHVNTVEDCAKVLVKNQAGHPRILDTKYHKSLAWRMAMTLDELWQAVKTDTASRRFRQHTHSRLHHFID
jgi:hypothetical protein